jgi:hypothetical protein
MAERQNAMTELKPFAPGDIFVTASDLDESARFPTGMGKVEQFAADWTLKAVFETGQKGLISSLTLDPVGNLHILDPQARSHISIGPDGKVKAMFANLPPAAYGSMIALADGQFLLGEHMVGGIAGFAGQGQVYRVNAAGDVLATHKTQTNGGMGGFLGVTHMALSTDGKRLMHVSETGADIYAHDLANDQRLGAFYTRADPPPMVFGIAGLADDSLLVACGNEVRQINGSGQVLRHYAMPEGRGWAVVVIRADGQSFWALDFFGGGVALVDLASGEIVQKRELGLVKCLAGIAEFRA